LRFDPNPTPNTYSILAIAYLLQGRYDDAIRMAQGAVGRHSHHITIHVALAAAYAEAGRSDEAAEAAAEVRRLHPFFEVDTFGLYFRDPGHRERIQAGLHKAGL
jgi:predicted Zn-dependent protease